MVIATAKLLGVITARGAFEKNLGGNAFRVYERASSA